jgi:hypothetical protein
VALSQRLDKLGLASLGIAVRGLKSEARSFEEGTQLGFKPVVEGAEF